MPLGIESSLLTMSPNEFRLFRTLIQRHTGIWLREGKEIMLASRLSRRLRELGMGNFSEYYNYVEGSCDGTGELVELINCVTTNKTSFFRERHHFDFLAGVALPEFVRNRSRSNRTINVWSAACSTGEEPYSIAITLMEAQERLHLPVAGWSPRVVASDIDTQVLATAAQGIYVENSLDEMDPVLRQKYFLRGKGDRTGYVKVKKQLTESVEFQHVNLMDSSWPVDSAFDAIFFRNALIYFRQETQDVFLRRMARRLRPGGYLFLGHSEHIAWLHDVFEPLPKTIYRLRPKAA